MSWHLMEMLQARGALQAQVRFWLKAGFRRSLHERPVWVETDNRPQIFDKLQEWAFFLKSMGV